MFPLDDNSKIIGTCGSCGGDVVKTFHNMMVGPQPPARCQKCGKIPESEKKPVLKMCD